MFTVETLEVMHIVKKKKKAVKLLAVSVITIRFIELYLQGLMQENIVL